MNKELLEKLFEYIDARLAEEIASDSSDGGLAESIYRRKLREELFNLVTP